MDTLRNENKKIQNTYNNQSSKCIQNMDLYEICINTQICNTVKFNWAYLI